MSLVNKETGQSATEAARQQATNIQLVEQIKALNKDIAAKNMQIAGLKEDKYAADARVESIANIKNRQRNMKRNTGENAAGRRRKNIIRDVRIVLGKHSIKGRENWIV